MEAEIKRIAQLLFDNAKYLSDELTKRKKYRYFNVDFQAHNATGTMDVSLWMGDEERNAGGYIMNEFFEIETIMRKWQEINEAVGITDLPEPIKTREKL